MNRAALFCIIWVLFVPSALFFHSSHAHAQEKKNLRVVFVSLSWNNQLPFRAAIAKGFFKEQGLAIEPIFVRGGRTAIRGTARGLDLHIVSSQSNYTNYTLIGATAHRRM